MDGAFVTGTESVIVKLQFDPGAAGERVAVIAGRGVELDAPDGTISISPRGECIVWARLAEGQTRGHILFYCKAIKTIVPLSRAPLAHVQAEETRTGGAR